LAVIMDKLQLTGQNMVRVFNSRSACMDAMQLLYFETKLPNLMLKTRPKQLLGSLPLDITLPAVILRDFWGERVSLLTVNLDKSVASFCHQVAARVPDIYSKFCLVENHTIANDSTTAEAREKDMHISRSFDC
jgi:hypothetical protein